MNQFFEKIGVEVEGYPILSAGSLTKGQFYFVGPDKGASKSRLTQELLKEFLSYDPETGVFRWRANIRRKPVGAVAGSKHKTGYIVIKVAKVVCYAHRLAFLYMNGRFPSANVDHKNRDRSDNSWENLRECSQTQNLGNVGLNRKNTSGVRGVSWYPARNKWIASISKGNKQHHLGYFLTINEARAAYDKAAKEYFGEFYLPSAP